MGENAKVRGRRVDISGNFERVQDQSEQENSRNIDFWKSLMFERCPGSMEVREESEIRFTGECNS